MKELLAAMILFAAGAVLVYDQVAAYGLKMAALLFLLSGLTVLGVVWAIKALSK